MGAVLTTRPRSRPISCQQYTQLAMDGKKRKHGYLDGEEEEESAAAASESHTFGDMDSSSDEDGENAPKLVDRQREAAVARMQRYFGLEDPVEPQEPIVQDDSNFLRKMYWTCIQDGGFPHRVNHAVAVHKLVRKSCSCWVHEHGGYRTSHGTGHGYVVPMPEW